MALVLLVAGCAQSDPVDVAPDEQVPVYAAVLRHYLTSKDHSFGEGHKFPAVYVLATAVPNLGSPDRAGQPEDGVAIGPAVQADLDRSLADVADLTFVASRDEVVVTVDSCQQVRDLGILITLGTFAPDDDRVEVGVFGYVACLGATWLTYVVTRDGATWKVTGTTGPAAVA